MSEAQLDSKISVLIELLADIESRISKLESEVKYHEELSRFNTEVASSPSLADIGHLVRESTELDDSTKDKIRKTADLILEYSKSVSYLGA